MGVDKMFKQLERRTERDLYRKTFRAVYKSQQSAGKNIGAQLKAARWKSIAREVFWFFFNPFFWDFYLVISCTKC